MRKFIMAVAMCATTTAHAEFFTGNDLFNKMNGTTSDQIQAIGYMQGVYDVLAYITFCPPTGITAGQITDMGRNYLANNPSQRHRTAERLMGDMFKQAWPCKNTSSGRGA